MKIGGDIMAESSVIARLAANTKSGYSLDRQFYCDDGVFAADMETVIGRKWIVAGHVDRVRHKGDYFLFKTCGYHAWSYGLAGALLAARLMPADFSKQDNGLHRCHIRVFHGFIFINLSDQAPPDFDAAFADLDPYLDFHGFAGAKITHTQSYPTSANWKLIF